MNPFLLSYFTFDIRCQVHHPVHQTIHEEHLLCGEEPNHRQLSRQGHRVRRSSHR